MDPSHVQLLFGDHNAQACLFLKAVASTFSASAQAANRYPVISVFSGCLGLEMGLRERWPWKVHVQALQLSPLLCVSGWCTVWPLPCPQFELRADPDCVATSYDIRSKKMISASRSYSPEFGKVMYETLLSLMMSLSLTQGTQVLLTQEV